MSLWWRVRWQARRFRSSRLDLPGARGPPPSAAGPTLTLPAPLIYQVFSESLPHARHYSKTQGYGRGKKETQFLTNVWWRNRWIDQPERSGLWEVFAGSQSHAGSREPSMVCRPPCRGRRQAGWGNSEEAGDSAALGRMGSLAMGYCQFNVQGPKKHWNCWVSSKKKAC